MLETFKTWYPDAIHSDTSVFFKEKKLEVEILLSSEDPQANQKKLIAAREAGVNIMSFHPHEIETKPDLVKSMIDRELGDCKTLHYSQVKKANITIEQLMEFLNAHVLTDVTEGTEWICVKDKRGIAAAIGLKEFENRVVVSHFIERMGLHVIRSIALMCDIIQGHTHKPLFIKLKADHGGLYHQTLNTNDYRFVFLTEPKEYNGIYDSGYSIFVPASQNEVTAILDT